MAEIVALTGQSFRATWDETTWRDYLALSRQWAEWPPPTVSLAVMAHLAPQLREDGNPGADPDPELAAQNRSMLESLIGAPAPA